MSTPARTSAEPSSVVLETQSGSRYHVDGDQVHLDRQGQERQTYRLIHVGEQRVRYTDGQQMYTSSEVVSRTSA